MRKYARAIEAGGAAMVLTQDSFAVTQLGSQLVICCNQQGFTLGGSTPFGGVSRAKK